MQFQLASSQCCLDACTIGCHRTMYWVHVHVPGAWRGPVPHQRAEQRPLRKKCAPPPSLGIRIGQDTKILSTHWQLLAPSISVYLCPLQDPTSLVPCRLRLRHFISSPSRPASILRSINFSPSSKHGLSLHHLAFSALQSVGLDCTSIYTPLVSRLSPIVNSFLLPNPSQSQFNSIPPILLPQFLETPPKCLAFPPSTSSQLPEPPLVLSWGKRFLCYLSPLS